VMLWPARGGPLLKKLSISASENPIDNIKKPDHEV
jgi:hypothetical protein